MRIVAFVVAALLLVGCGTAAEPRSSGSLDGRSFLSTGVTENGEPRELEPDTRIRLSFTAGELTAAAGCNTMGGEYRLDDGVLVVSALRMTMIGCPDPLAKQDTWLSGLLESGPSVLIDGDELTLTSRTTTIALLDRTVADPDRSLVGPEWRVDSLISGDAVSSVPGEGRASLTFTEDGGVSVRTGCNTGRGRYTTGPGTITISDVVLTRMACLDERGELERAVLEVIEAPELAVRIAAATLTLTAGEKGLQLRTD
jgi:heat shock protein HslJ